MKNIIDLCNVNITNSLHSLLEVSILDIDANMKAGDDYAALMNNIEKEFNLIKKLTINTFRKGNDEYRWYCPNFLKMCLGAGDYIVFTLNIYGDDDNGGDYFVDCAMYVIDEKNFKISNDIDFVTTGEVFKTATLAVEDLVKNIKNEFKFKNLQKLVKYIKTNTKMSKLDLSWD